MTSCSNGRQQNIRATNDSLKTTNSISLESQKKIDTLEIICDSVYKNKGYKLTLRTFDTANIYETKPNTIFALCKLINGHYSEIFRDTIFNEVQEVQFEDYNNDKVKDILVQNFSDVRSNWSYNLYLVDTTNDKLKRIKGFEEIKVPVYNSKYDLIENYVLSGRNWTSFYKIKSDSILDYGITIYDGEDDNGKTTYDKGYKKAIKIILAKEKNNR